MTASAPRTRPDTTPWITRTASGLLLAWLTGCGPGVGGTGSGSEPPLVVFGASPSPVCTSVIAPALACASVTDSPAQAGTSVVVYGALTPLGRLRSVFDGQRVTASIDCLGWRFEGEWGTDTRGRQRYYGTLVQATGGAAEPAQLVLQPVTATTGGALLRATVLDTSERTLLGPVDLRLEAGATPPACP